jgi:hypothetical protein
VSQDWRCVQYKKIIICLLCVEISLVDNQTSFNQKNLSYLVLLGYDFHPLVMSDDLNEHEADCVHLQT